MNIISEIKPLIDKGTLFHAVLFEGENAFAAAEYTACAAVCRGENKPCGGCSACVKAASGNHPDIEIYQPKSAANPYPVDVVREIRAHSYIVPNESLHKVFILDDIDNISVQSQNALLKILEEPPEYVVFLLVCRQKSFLLDTVISRVICFSGTDEAQRQPDEADETAVQTACDIATAAVCGSEYELLSLLAKLAYDKPLFAAVTGRLVELFRRVYLNKSGIDIPQDEMSGTVEKILPQLTTARTLALIDAVDKTTAAASFNANANLNMSRFGALLKAAMNK